jgi:hypothetical protein
MDAGYLREQRSIGEKTMRNLQILATQDREMEESCRNYVMGICTYLSSNLVSKSNQRVVTRSGLIREGTRLNQCVQSNAFMCSTKLRLVRVEN